jgi:class 3 adenylate cyclase
MPETRYVRFGDADIAYQVVGDGPLDLIYCAGVQHLEVQWEHPSRADFLNRLASFSRLILFDRRGWGASDPLPHGESPTWEGWTDDIRVVLDAAGSESAAVFGELDGGPICTLFAAMHPQRVRALVLANAAARNLRSDDYPIGYTEEEAEATVKLIESTWGSVDLAKIGFPSRAEDVQFLRWSARLQRAAATPRSAAVQYGYMIRSMDIRSVLDAIQMPTLVLNTTGNAFTPFDHGRYLAEQIRGARFVEIESSDTLLYADAADRAIERIATFLTGRLPPVEPDRVLTTILFTDIVDSTSRAAAEGDHRWHSTLAAHDRVVREQLEMHRGRELGTAGDGFLISFDGAARAIRCARAIVEATAAIGIPVRAGLHTGECETREEGLAGLAVHIAARVAGVAGAGDVLVSRTLRELVFGSGLDFEEAGVHALKGVDGNWQVFRLST